MTPRWVWDGTVPSLDGLRGLSITVVVMHHAALAEGAGGTGVLGFVGVDLFFVISGFLITLLLLREHRRTGAVSLRGFYLRRACRIMPAYVAFLLALAAFESVVPLSPRDWLALATYTVNFTSVPWEVSHVWSLCVEEHFYLLWPAAVVAAGTRRAWWVAAGCVLVTPLVRWAAVEFAPGALDLVKSTPSRMDTLAAGCCLASLAVRPATFRAAPPSPLLAAFLAAALVLVLVAVKAALVALGDRFLVVYPSVNAAAVAGLVWLGVTHADTWVGRVLDSRPLRAVGLISYSVYIWHKLFITPNRTGWATEWPANLALVAAAAVASYVLIEKPFLRLKDRFGRRQ